VERHCRRPNAISRVQLEANMYTTILAYVIASQGLAIGMICGGFVVGGIVQVLRVLVTIATRLQNMD
jgi:hypothetical protein